MKHFSFKLICIFFNIIYVNSELQQPLLTLHNNDFSSGSSNASDTCFLPEIECDPADKYRSFDGSCNNLKHPTWGMVNTAFTRLFRPAYSDGEALLKKAYDGSDLPSARALSLQLFQDEDVADNVTLMTLSFAQFMTHDISITPSQKSNCSSCSYSDPLSCSQISVPEDDPLYSKFNISCIKFKRSRVTLTGNCEGGSRQQINGVTHFIDASQVYGSDKETVMSLRSKNGGKLLVREVDNRSFLIQTKEGNICKNSSVCYKAGDARVNQNLPLTVLHTVFLREHNRIAEKLAVLHPTWDDERLFQETRVILAAQLQHIIYNHYLPHILEDYMEKYKLNLNYEYKYNEDVMNLIINCFTAATFRVLHSGIQGVLNLYNYQLNLTKKVNLVEWVDSPGLVEAPNYFDGFLLGLIKQKMQKIDPFYNKQMNGVFQSGGINPIGVDLSAIDIQRGRDHGLPSYTTVLQACTGVFVRDFDELRQFISAPDINKLAGSYSYAEDIDLFVGVNFETRKSGERLGPVGKCIVAEQFYRLKYGDRYWYQNLDQPCPFTPEQLAEIKKASLARIVCDNSDGIVNITTNVFHPPSLSNKITSCENIPAINLDLF